jgi:CheY-like chemotaxis protein
VLTLLIVDDDEAIRGTLAEGLGLAGYRVIAVPTSAEGLAEAKSDRPIDVAVIDIKMPASSEANGTIFLLQFNLAFLHSATAPNEPKSRG